MSTLAALARQERNRGKGVVGSLTKAIGQKTLEKIDLRNYMFSQDGMVNALFKSSRGYKPRAYKRAGGDYGETQRPAERSASGLVVKMEVIARNTSFLPIMARDMSIIRKNIIKMTKALGVEPSRTPGSRFRAVEEEYESKFDKDKISPTKSEGDGKKDDGWSLSKILGIGAIVGGVVTGLGMYFNDPEFKSKVDGMVNSFGETVFGKETWTGFKDTITGGFKSITDEIGKVWDEHWVKILAGVGILTTILNPAGTLLAAFKSLELGVKGILLLFNNPLFVSALAGVGVVVKAGEGMLDAAGLAYDAVTGKELTEEQGQRLKSYGEGAVVPSYEPEEPKAPTIEDKKKELEEQKSFLNKPDAKTDDEKKAAIKRNIRKTEKEISSMEFQKGKETGAPSLLTGQPLPQQPLSTVENINQKNIDNSKFTETSTPTKMSGDLGSLSAKYESGKKGSEAVGWDSTGGTSYGKYQIASKTGTMNNFMEFLEKDNPELYEKLSGAGPIDGGKEGAFAQKWKELAKEGALGDVEHKFIQKTHYDPALKGVKSEELKDKINNSKALQDVLWSTSVQHGAGGASGILNKVYKPGMSEEELIKATYSERSTRFNSSSPNVQNSVKNRFKDEEKNALAMLSSNSSTPSLTPPTQVPIETQKAPQEPIVASMTPPKLPQGLTGTDYKQQFESVLQQFQTGLLGANREVLAPPPPISSGGQKTIAQAPAPNMSTEILDIDISKLVLNIA